MQLQIDRLPAEKPVSWVGKLEIPKSFKFSDFGSGTQRLAGGALSALSWLVEAR